MRLDALLPPALFLSIAVLAPLWALALRRLALRWNEGPRFGKWSAASALAFSGVAAALSLYAVFVEPASLVVRRYDVISPAWRGAPLTIAAIADTHVGAPAMPAQRVRDIVRRVNGLRPDLVVLLGDYVASEHRNSDETHPAAAESISYFALLQAPLGVVAVTGNHDFDAGPAFIRTQLENAGVAVPRNRFVLMRHRGASFAVAGLADDEDYDPDFSMALSGLPDRTPAIVLSHRPDPFAAAPRGLALLFAAHTHCGQIAPPLIGPILVPSAFGRRYACGLVWEQGAPIIISGGLGTSILPVRFGAPPEITMVTLRAPPPPSSPRPSN